MKRILVYHFQYMVGGCKGCNSHFSNAMIADYEKCHRLAAMIYPDEECHFYHYSDLGRYDADTLYRPSFRRLQEDLKEHEYDVFMCYSTKNVTTNQKLLQEFIQQLRDKNMDILTVEDTEEIMGITV